MKWTLVLLLMPAPEQWLKGRLEYVLKRSVERAEVLLFQEARVVNSVLLWALRDYPKPASLTDLLSRAPLRMLQLRDPEGNLINLASESAPIRVRWDGESAWVEAQLGPDLYSFKKKNWAKRQPVSVYARTHREYLARRDHFAPTARDREVFYYCAYLHSILWRYERQELEGVKGRGYRSVAEVEGLYPFWDLSLFRNPYTGKPPRLVSLQERAPGEVTLLPVRGRRGNEMLDTMLVLCWNGDRKPVNPAVLQLAQEGLPEQALAWRKEMLDWLRGYVQQYGAVTQEEVKAAKEDALPSG